MKTRTFRLKVYPDTMPPDEVIWDILFNSKRRREKRAAEWLAPLLDIATRRDDHKAECMERFKVSERAFEERIWPMARKLAGLAEKSPPGPKRKPVK